MKWLQLLYNPKLRAFVAVALEIYAKRLRDELTSEEALSALITAFHEHF